MNDTIRLICAHKSERQLTEQPLPAAIIDKLIDCAQAAASSQFIQAYSIIHITDTALKNQLAALSGQAHAAKNGALFVMTADLYRHAQLLDDKTELSTAEALLTAAADTAIAAQNLIIGAESLGLGTCYLGALRSHDQAVINLLQLPQYTYPLFGIAAGYIENHADTPAKPRLPRHAILMENHYRTEMPDLDCYNDTLIRYYQNRGIRGEAWTDRIRSIFSRPLRRHVSASLKKQNLNQL